MRTLFVLFALALPALFAQNQTTPTGKFYGPLATGDWKGMLPTAPPAIDPDRRTFFSLPVEAKSSTCAVPLLPMEIAKDMKFTAQVVSPDLQKVAPMPQARLYAPPCDPTK